MHELVRESLARLPLQFRVLYRQFLLRVVDLEGLSIEADIPRFLGQFAGILILASLIQALGAVMFPEPPVWHIEQADIALTMLVTGLIAVFTWDNTFPDHRDAMVLGPLPLKPRVILLAKIIASAALIGMAVVCVNFASSAGWSIVFAASRGFGSFLRFFASFWLTMVAASVFLYSSLLTIQGLSAWLLPRRVFLRFSAIIQVAAFGLLISVYFLESYIELPADLLAIRDQGMAAASPVLWFFALFNQCNGSLPTSGLWLAERAWIGLACAVLGATVSLLLCYLHTMRKTVEEPDLVPGGRSLRLARWLGGSLQSAILLFILRTIRRSRQHRVILAFFYSIVLACVLDLLHKAPRLGSTAPLSLDLVVETVWMMVFAVLGFRAIIPLPISHTANWMLRITQFRSPERYIAAVRRSLLALSVAPVWVAAALLSLPYRPFTQAASHLAFLLLLGLILAECSLIGFYKIPFTCSIVPGKTNFQYVFWGGLAGFMVMLIFILSVEFPALGHRAHFALLLLVLTAAAVGAGIFNRLRSRSAVIYFEEPPEEIVTTLGLTRDGVSIAKF